MPDRQPSVFMRGLRIIGSYIQMHPWPFGIAVGGAAVYAAATVASAVVLGRVTDRVIVPAFEGDVGSSTVIGGVVAVVGVAVIRAGGIIARRYFAGMTAARVQTTLRYRVVDRYRELPLAYHRAKPTGELLAHAEADVEAATEVLHPLPFSTAVILLVVIAVAALLVTDLFLAAIGLVTLPVLAVLNRMFGRSIEPPATRAQQRVGELSSVAHESFDGALVVKTLGREQDEVARLADKAAQLRHERVTFGRMRATFEPSFDALPNLSVVVLLAVGSWRISTGDISTGTLVQFVSLFQLLAFPMRLIGWVLSDIPRAVVGRERLEGVFEEEIGMPPATEAVDLPEGPLGVSVRNVSFSYDSNRVLNRLSFEVAPNESVALVGATGVGKSTVAELLVRLADPDDGSIRLGGADVRHIGFGRLQQAAAVVFQESFLFATSVRDNIALDFASSQEEIHEAARLAQAHDFILGLPNGYDTVVGERGVTVSGGQRQRIALARALLRRPRLLILDDATSSVDPTVEAAILEGLKTKLNATLIVIAYRISTITLADRVVFLEDGRVVAQGTHEELLAHPAYESMVTAYDRATA
ncbi:MAG: ABC transporter ATP-binding protein [Actinomycetota bacterium]